MSSTIPPFDNPQPADDKKSWRYDDTTGTAELFTPGAWTQAATAPTSPAPGDRWLDTDDAIESVWDGVQWLAPAPWKQIHYGTTAPPNPVTGDFWLDTT